MSFRRDGSILHNAARPLIADLDSLPFPARDPFPQHHLGIGLAPIVGSRGCHQNCSFCSIHAFYGASRGRLQRFRSVPNLADEMQGLYDAGGVRFFVFNDDEWLPPGPERAQRVDALERELGARGLDVIMSIKCRADDVEEDLFRRLRDVGVARVYVGIESGSATTLDVLGKGTTVERNIEALAALDTLGIAADFRMLLFHPWSTLQTVSDDVSFLERVAPHLSTPVDVREVEVYAGTPLATRLQAERDGLGVVRYAIPDARVELLRRLNRLIGAPGGAYARVQGLFTQISFDYLVQSRLSPSPDGAEPAEALKRAAASVNGELVALWKEMLGLAETGDIRNAAHVNAQAAEWLARLHRVHLRVAEEWSGRS